MRRAHNDVAVAAALQKTAPRPARERRVDVRAHDPFRLVALYRTVNTVTGDYSRGASGFWVENGEIQYPVEEITIAGNLADMFMKIAAIGNDIDGRGNIQCGSILIENMTIAGGS